MRPLHPKSLDGLEDINLLFSQDLVDTLHDGTQHTCSANTTPEIIVTENVITRTFTWLTLSAISHYFKTRNGSKLEQLCLVGWKESLKLVGVLSKENIVKFALKMFNQFHCVRY